MTLSCETTTEYASFDSYPVYEGTDLGFTYMPKKTRFRLWSPAASEVKLHLYDQGHGNNLVASHAMKRSEGGTWYLELKGDHKNQYYTYQVKQGGQWRQEKADPYAKAVGVNGHRAMILEMDETDPQG